MVTECWTVWGRLSVPWNQTGLAAEEGGLGTGLGHSLRKPERKGSSEEEELKQRCRGEHTWSKWESLLEKLPQEDRKRNSNS